MPVSMTATPTPRPVPRYVFQRYGAWIDWLKLVESVSPFACGLIAPFSETAWTSGRAASSRAPAAGSVATTALMMCRSRVTVPPSSRTTGAAAERVVPGLSWTMTSTRLAGVRSAMLGERRRQRRRGIGDGRRGARGGQLDVRARESDGQGDGDREQRDADHPAHTEDDVRCVGH